VRIVIGEDSTLFREGLASLLIEAGHDIVGRAADAKTLLEVVTETLPDLAVIDVRMPPDLTDDGARAARRIRQTTPDVALVLLSQHVETKHSVDLVSSGGFGYLLKDRVLDVEDFLDSLTRVAAGGSALDPEVVGRLLGQPNTPAALTPREREVLGLMAQGLTNVGIARRLFLNDRTVETHVSSILSKLGIQTSAEEHRRVVAVLTYLGERIAT
jgi:DNA-binding NarL/FixJ family response regulator